MWKRIMAGAAALLLLCGGLRLDEEAVPTAAAATNAEPRELVFLLDSRESEIFRTGAALFAEHALRLSEGTLRVRLEPQDNPADAFEAGRGDFCFLDGWANGSVSEDFPVLCEPLAYQNYQRFTMGLNSSKMLGALNDGLAEEGKDIRLMGAFYQGSRRLLSVYPIRQGDLELLQFPGDPEEREGPLLAALPEDSQLAGAVTAYGMEAVTENQSQQRQFLLQEREAAVAEFTYPELIELDLERTTLYLLETSHSMIPRWLAVRRSTCDGLSPREQAALAEACAYLYPVIDQEILSEEQAALRKLEDGEIQLEGDFSALREAAGRITGKTGIQKIRRKYLLDMIDKMA